MPGQPITVRHDIRVDAAPEALFDLVADTQGAARFAASQLHAEVRETDGDRDLVRRWVYAGGRARSWEVRRTLDRPALRIVFTHEGSSRGEQGEWLFTAQADGSTLIEVTHSTHPDAVENINRNVPAQLAVYKSAGELGPDQARLYVTHEETVPVAGSVDDVFARLLHPGVWAALDPAATGVEVTRLLEDTELVELAGGGEVSSRHVRIVLGGGQLVHKLVSGDGGAAEVGRWSVHASAGGGAELRLSGTRTLAREALGRSLEAFRAEASAALRTRLRRVAEAVTATEPAATRA